MDTKPTHDLFSITLSHAADLHITGMIDHGLDSQYAPVFVVHFYPVLFHPVLDSCTRPPLCLEIIENLACEIVNASSTERGQHILGTEAQGRVPQQFLIQEVKRFSTLEEHVRGKLRLVNDPVVLVVRKDALKQWVHHAGKAMKNPGPVLVRELVSHSLSPLGLFEPKEGVIQAFVSKAMFVHFLRQPLVAVNVDLDGHGKPSLDTDVYETKLSVNEVVVDMKTLPLTGFHGRSLLCIDEPEAGTRLYCG